MRVHLTACGYVLFFAFRIGLTRGELCCILLAMGLVTGAETMNTAVERLCDHVHRDYNSEIGRVKDLAAGAVLLCAAFAAGVGCVVFIRPQLWQELCDIAAEPWKLGLFLGSLAVSGGFVFMLPRRS